MTPHALLQQLVDEHAIVCTTDCERGAPEGVHIESCPLGSVLAFLASTALVTDKPKVSDDAEALRMNIADLDRRLNALKNLQHERDQWRRNYYDVADALAAGSSSPAHLASIARDLRQQLAQRDRRIEKLTELLRDAHMFLRSSLRHCADREPTPWFVGLQHMVLVLDAALSAPAQPATATKDGEDFLILPQPEVRPGGRFVRVAAPPSPAVYDVAKCQESSKIIASAKCLNWLPCEQHAAPSSPAARDPLGFDPLRGGTYATVADVESVIGAAREATTLVKWKCAACDLLTGRDPCVWCGKKREASADPHENLRRLMQGEATGVEEPDTGALAFTPDDNSSSQAVVDRLVSAIGSIDMINRRHEDSMNGANVYTRGIRDEVIAALDAARSK